MADYDNRNRRDLPIFENKTLSFPDRSILASIEPYNIGLVHVEGMTNYITRIALWHYLRPASLIKSKIFERLNIKGSVYATYNYSNVFGAVMSSVETAEKWIEILTQLTMQSDLDKLTMYPARNLFSNKGLIKLVKSWCPQCIRDYKMKKELNVPLIWSIQAYKYCYIHQVKLVEKCPNPDCAKNIPHFPKFPFPHLCPYCFHALDKADSNHPYSNAELEEVAYEVWKSTMIGQIFSLLQSHPDRFEMQLFSKNLKILVREMFGFDETPYGIWKLTGISARNFSNWLNGNTKISMRSILNVIYVFNISPKQLLIDIESVEAGEIRSVKKLGFRQRVSKPANGLC